MPSLSLSGRSPTPLVVRRSASSAPRPRSPPKASLRRLRSAWARPRGVAARAAALAPLGARGAGAPLLGFSTRPRPPSCPCLCCAGAPPRWASAGGVVLRNSCAVVWGRSARSLASRAVLAAVGGVAPAGLRSAPLPLASLLFRSAVRSWGSSPRSARGVRPLASLGGLVACGSVIVQRHAKPPPCWAAS